MPFRLCPFLLLVAVALVQPVSSTFANENGLSALQNDARRSQPIEIVADELEVQQKHNIATFTGNVVAIQSDFELKANEMTVFYRTDDSKSGESVGNAISKIETKGDVSLKTPKESATSSYGVYDIDTQILTLNGDVQLSSGDNTVSGTKLVYDITEGKSRLISKANEGDDAKKKSKERVRGVFVPSQSPTNKKESPKETE